MFRADAAFILQEVEECSTSMQDTSLTGQEMATL